MTFLPIFIKIRIGEMEGANMNEVEKIEKNVVCCQPAENVCSQHTMLEFVEWIDRSQKTTQTYLTNLRQFAAWMSYRNVVAPARLDIIAYREWLSSEHDAIQYDPDQGYQFRRGKDGQIKRIRCKASTVSGYLRTVKEFFAWTASEGIYPNVAENVHTPKLSDEPKKDALTAKDVQTIEQEIKQSGDKKIQLAATARKDKASKEVRAQEQKARLLAIYELAVTAGLRTVEISRLNVEDFVKRGDSSYLMVWSKGHSEADTRVPIAAEVSEVISSYLRIRKDSFTATSPLFVSTGNRSGGKRIQAKTIGTMLKDAMVKSGYDDSRITAHSLRHTCGTSMMEMTGNLFQTQKYLRHVSPETTEKYIHIQDDKMNARNAEELYHFLHA